MNRIPPKGLLALGVFLMLLGIALPLLMVIHVIESTFFLNFFSYAASLGGLIIATIGMVVYTSTKRH